MAETTCATPEEQGQADFVRRKFSAYVAAIDQWLRKGEALKSPSLPPPQELTSLAQVVATGCKSLLELNERSMADGSQRNWRLANMMTIVHFGFVISGPAIGILLGLWIARGIRRSISQISVTLSDAAGELQHEVGQVDLIASDDLPALHEQVQVVASRIRQVVDELQQARREMMRAERLAAVGQLAAGVAHEIRNPLTAVKLLVQTAAQKSPSHALTDKQLEVVQEEIARIEKTVQGLLDFARPPRLRPVRHDLCETLRRAVRLAEGRARQRQVAIEEDFPGDPVMFTGDPGQLQQVFVNLLLNGIEAMPDGGVLRVAIRQNGHPGGLCQVVISDSGTGIPKDVLERLFEPFVTGREHGTGLGLAISRRIVRQHGGTLSGANRPEGGAEFKVELPVEIAAGPSELEEERSVPAQPHRDVRVASAPGG
jgi:signal transduction histidine kinase